MTAACEWGGELEIALGIARTYPGGEWDYSEWDASEWEQTDTSLGDWFDITCDVADGIALRAGSNKSDGVADRWEAATAHLELFGNAYNPRTGPWAGLLGPGLPIRIRWRPTTAASRAKVAALPIPRDTADWSVVFQGTVENGGYKWDPMERVASLTCVDLTTALVAYEALPTEPPIAAHEFASARVHRHADTARLTAAQRDITRGGITLLASKLEGSLWAQLLKVADTDIALLWVRRDGRLAYRPEGRVAENVPIAAELVACPEDVPPAPPLTPNLIPTDDPASFEGGTMGAEGIVAGGAGTVVTTTADDGTRSLAATATSAGPYYQPVGRSLATSMSVTAGQTYTLMASLRPTMAGRTYYLGAAWWRADSTVSFDWGAQLPLGAANVWQRVTRKAIAPAGAVGVAILVSPRGMATNGTERTYIDRVGVFAGAVDSDAWRLPSYAPPIANQPIGYVNLLHADPEVLRNYVTVARRKIEGEATDPPIVVRTDDASISRFGPVTYRAIDLEHDVDSWSSVVADVLISDGAWPSLAPTEATFDTRTHGNQPEVPALLLGLEPEHVFQVVDPLLPSTSWRMICDGWDVDLRRDRITGSIFLDDVTGWGDAAGWDDPAPPHGWDVDVWALSGFNPDGTLPNPRPVTYSMAASAVTDLVPPGAITTIPLVDPFTGHPAGSFVTPAGRYSLAGSVTFAPTTTAVAVRVAIRVNGNEVATANGTTSTTGTITVGVNLAASEYASSFTWELVAVATASPARVTPPTTLTITPA